MKATLIGSAAIKHWFPEFNREPKDLDYAVDDPKAKSFFEDSGIKVEYLYNPVFDKINYAIAKPEHLLALKVSHLFWDTNWVKHMWDVQFLRDRGVEFSYPLYKEFRNFFEEYLPKIRRSDLEQSKDSFFDNAVNEDTNEHDEYHLKIADTPAYTKILKDGCEVELDFDKWEALKYSEKIDVAVEEAVVMAYERYSGKIPWYLAFTHQLRQNIIKHYPEPIALFAIFNYRDLTNLRQLEVEKLFNKLEYESRRIS